MNVANKEKRDKRGEKRGNRGKESENVEKKLIDHCQLLLMWPVIMSNGQLLLLASGFN